MLLPRLRYSIVCLHLSWLMGSYCLAQSPSVDLEQIGPRLKPLIEAHAGEVAVSLRVLDSDGVVVGKWQHDAQKVMPTASLIKLPVMIEAYRQAAAGKLSLDDMVELRTEDKVPGTGILTEHFSAGAQLSLRDAIRLMIRYSDNTATNLVIDRLGLAATSQEMKRLGMPETQLHAKVFRRDTSIAPERSEKYGLGSTTADDMCELLTQLEQGKLVSAEASQQMLEHLLACEDRGKIPRLLPSDCRVAHKTGAVSQSRTDAGIVYLPEGSFVLCVLTDNNADSSWDDDNAAHVLCGRIAREIYDLLGPSTAMPLAPQALTVGANGKLVEALQRTLNARIEAELGIDGDFGPATEAAVKQFQAIQQLPESGVVDTATWAALGDLITEDAPVPAPSVVNRERLETAPPLDPHAPPQVTAKAWVVVDAASGKTLGESQAAKRLPQASTTKIMTAFLVLDLAERQPAVLDEMVTFSQRADNTLGSTSGVRAGEQLTVRELMYGLLLPSGNDASVALAEHFGQRLGEKCGATEGDAYDKFIAAMNAKAAQLNLANTHFANPHGLTADEHYSSAADLATLARLSLQLPLMCEIMQCRQRGCQLKSLDGYSRNVLWKNTNRLLEQEGFGGMKTGTTSAAGACLVAVGQQQGQQQIVVLLGSESTRARYVDARNLFAWAWRQSAKP